MIKITLRLDIWHYPHWKQTKAERRNLYHTFQQRLIDENEHKNVTDKVTFWKAQLSDFCNTFRKFVVDSMDDELK